MLEKLVRKNIQQLKPYSSARDEFKGGEAIFLDANENPYGSVNRYPDPHQTTLKQELAKLKNISVSQIFVGNGSDEVIDLSIRIFCEPNQDKVMICPPTYGMYEVSADINNAEVVKAPLNSDFQLDVEKILQFSKGVKVLFLCSPNNPTGNSLEDIETILQNFQGMVVVDEAYIDFSRRDSFLTKIDEFPNLLVSQTFSKARALAGARVGLAFANREVIQIYNRVKPPYNVSTLNQQAALKSLLDPSEFEKNRALILQERQKLIAELQNIALIKHIYPTDANFVLVKVENATRLYTHLVKQGIVIRNRHNDISNTLRISVGTPYENEKLLNELKKI